MQVTSAEVGKLCCQVEEAGKQRRWRRLGDVHYAPQGKRPDTLDEGAVGLVLLAAVFVDVADGAEETQPTAWRRCNAAERATASVRLGRRVDLASSTTIRSPAGTP